MCVLHTHRGFTSVLFIYVSTVKSLSQGREDLTVITLEEAVHTNNILDEEDEEEFVELLQKCLRVIAQFTKVVITQRNLSVYNLLFNKFPHIY